MASRSDNVIPIGDAMARFRELAEQAAEKAPSREDARSAARLKAEAAALRESRLESENEEFAVAPVITAEDREAIIRGTLRPTHALEQARAWRRSFRGSDGQICPQADHRPFLTLFGPTGRGKTVAGAWLIAHEGGLYVSAEELAKRVTAPSWRDTPWADRVLRARVVVLDDVGTEGGDPRAAMFEFVNRRQGLSRALTLITSNLENRAAFVKRYGDQVVRRLEHVGRMVEVTGEDLRRRG